MNYLLIAGAVLGAGLLLWDPVVAMIPKRRVRASGFEDMLEEFLACPDTTRAQRESVKTALHVLVSHKVRHEVKDLIPPEESENAE